MLTRDTFCYVPLLSTLKQILEVPSFRQEILRSADHQDNLMYDLSDGCMFKKHAFFKSNPNGLQVIAYYDEVETCNPLGSSSGKFKLGCVFFYTRKYKTSVSVWSEGYFSCRSGKISHR